jgi:gamma-glutamyltranspeptidase/glutathione hydrolase
LGEKIVGAVQDQGGLLNMSDFQEHKSEWVEPIKTSYRGFDVFEMPPNNQGAAALIALNIVEGYQLSQMTHNSPEYLHLLIEATKAALSDARDQIGDPTKSIKLDKLLAKDHAEEWRSRITSGKARPINQSVEKVSGDTVYVAVVDEKRNVVSMISSLFKLFGSGVTVPGTGVVLQNRGSGFTLEPDHPNSLAPGKRPYHTIMPGVIMRDGQPWVCLGVVGGMMQAQGHLQLICNLIDFEMDPQSALDAPRFRVLEDGLLALEDSLPEDARAKLELCGHKIKSVLHEEGFGGGQVILLSQGMLYGGSDPRKDGCALGF